MSVMARPPSAPAAESVRLRGNYALAAADYSVAQDYAAYRDEDHAIWRQLYERQHELVEQYGAAEVLSGLAALHARAQVIPDFNAVNARLAGLTGWSIVGVPGLIPDEQFYQFLAARRFPVSVWIRERHELDYLAEPDLFHDFFGHVALLTNPVFARFMQAYGAAGPKALQHNAVDILARLYWYTVEFGLINTPRGLKAFGAGILSSSTETRYSIESPIPKRIGFELLRVMRTAYLIDDLQKNYFVLESFEQLFHAGYDHDFAPLYARVRALPGIAPGELLPGERCYG